MPGCGKLNKFGVACGSVVAGIQTVRCRACAYSQDDEKAIRAAWAAADRHRGASKKPRSRRRQTHV